MHFGGDLCLRYGRTAQSRRTDVVMGLCLRMGRMKHEDIPNRLDEQTKCASKCAWMFTTNNR